MESYENKTAVTMVAFCGALTMFAVFFDPAALWGPLQGIVGMAGVYVFVNAEPAIVRNFYRNFFTIAWHSIL